MHADDKAHNVTMVVCMKDHEVFDVDAFNNATGNKLSLNLTSEGIVFEITKRLDGNGDNRATSTIYSKCWGNPWRVQTPTNIQWRCRGGNVQRQRMLPNIEDCEVSLEYWCLLPVLLPVSTRHCLVQWSGLWPNWVTGDAVHNVKQRTFRKGHNFQNLFHSDQVNYSQRIDPSCDRLTVATIHYNNKTWYNHFGVRHSLVSSNLKQHYFWHLSSDSKVSKTWNGRMGNAAEETHREKLTAGCVEQKTKNLFVRQSPMSIVWEGNKMKMLSDYDLKGPWEKRFWRRIARECNSLYRDIIGCTEQRLVTAIEERRIGDNFTIYEMIPSLPSMDYSHNPQMDIETFILAIGAHSSRPGSDSLSTPGCPVDGTEPRKTAPVVAVASQATSLMTTRSASLTWNYKWRKFGKPLTKWRRKLDTLEMVKEWGPMSMMRWWTWRTKWRAWTMNPGVRIVGTVAVLMPAEMSSSKWILFSRRYWVVSGTSSEFILIQLREFHVTPNHPLQMIPDLIFLFVIRLVELPLRTVGTLGGLSIAEPIWASYEGRKHNHDHKSEDPSYILNTNHRKTCLITDK